MAKRTQVSGSYRAAVVMLAAVSALPIAACSSSKQTATADGGFLTKANAICAVAVAKHDRHPFPVPDFDPLHPRARDLPVVGRYLAQYGDARAIAARLGALSAPANHQADWEKLQALIDQATANAQRQIAAAERSDVTGFEQTVATARSLSQQIDEAGTELGFTSSSACSKVFG